MSTSMMRLLMAVLLCSGLTMTACGSDDGDNNDSGNNNTPECTADADCADGESCDADGMCVADMADECTADADCADGESCVDNMCVADAECAVNTDCADGEVCNSGVCETPEAECTQNTDCGAGEFCDEAGQCATGQCDSVGVTCDPNGDQPGNGFICLTAGEGDAYCTVTCDPNAESDECSTGRECLGLAAGAGGACAVTQCQLGSDDCGAGTSCQPISLDTNLCLAPGAGAEGDECFDDFTLETTGCADGLFCNLFTGTCDAPCGADSDCAAGSCVGDGDSDIYSAQEGFCADGCDPFGDRDACGVGQGCFPLTSDEGLCQDAGDVELYESCAVTQCGSDADCPSGVTCDVDNNVCDYGNQCAAGGRCLTLEAPAGNGQDGVARCLPSCDPTAGDQAAADATCPGANPQSFARFVHLAKSLEAVAVDLYVDGTSIATDVAFEGGAPASLPFGAFPAGMVQVEIFAAGADPAADTAVIDAMVELVANEQTTFMVVDALNAAQDGVEPAVQAYKTTRDVASVATEAKLRIFHGADNLGGNVDIYVAPADTPEVDVETAGALLTDFAYGDISPYVTVPGGSYDAYVVPTGAGLDDPSTLVVEDIAVAADTISTVVARGVGGFVDAGLTILPFATTEASRALGGYCLDLTNGEDPSPQSGICFEDCASPDNYGKGLCSEEADNCSAFRARHVCLPSEDIAVGEACDPSGFNPCEAGSYCRSYGDGTGLCAKQCVPSGTDNDVLGCPADEACQQFSDTFDFGECGFECAATDFADATCPENLQNCQSTDSDFCAASGDVANGEDCGDIFPNSCEAGNVCRASVVDGTSFVDGLLQPIQPNQGVSGQCRTLCSINPDAAETGCGADEVCAIDGGTLSDEWGFCMEFVTDCTPDNFGQPCADRGWCGAGQGGPTCLELCRLDTTDDGCSTGTCRAGFQSADGTIEGWGICL